MKSFLFTEWFSDFFPRDLHKTERRDIHKRGLDRILREMKAELTQKLLCMLLCFKVNKVNDDDS